MSDKKAPNKIALEREIKRLQMMQDWTTLQGKLWIGISFTHMMVTMLLFRTTADGLWRIIQTGVIGVTVLLLDLGIMHYSHILYKAKEAGLETPIRVLLTYYIAVASEWVFNFASLYSNRPPAAKMPGAMSTGLAVLFGSFVTLSILNAPLLVSFLDKIIYDNLAAQSDLIKAEQAEQERKARAEREEQDRRDELARRNAERRERRLLAPPSTRRLGTVHEDDKYQPKAVNVDEKMVILVDGVDKKIDARAPVWLTMQAEQKMSFQQISDALGGKPSKAYIGATVKLYREYLQQEAH